jgi:CBS domain-containing protein
MVQHNCGEVPVVDNDGQLIGVVTDRDIVCRVVAAGKNPLEHTVQDCISQLPITVHPDTTITDVMTTMERHQIRPVPVVDSTSTASALWRRPISRGPGSRRMWRCWCGKCDATPTCRRADHGDSSPRRRRTKPLGNVLTRG